MKIKAIFFDIDGTLVDSNDLHVRAWREAFHSVGQDFTDQSIHDQIGKGTDMLVPALMPEASDEQQNKLGKAQRDIFKGKYMDQVRAFPAARDLLVRVYDAGQKVVLASSASKDELDYYLDLLQVRDIVSATTTADDVENTKPAPDIFAVALQKIAPATAKEVIVIGDTPYDMDAAAKCGIAAVGLRSGRCSDEALLKAGALALYDDVAALLATYNASLLAA